MCIRDSACGDDDLFRFKGERRGRWSYLADQPDTVPLDDPVRPERATYFDVGVDQKLLSGLAVGLDVYYKRSTDTLDDGQFGQAVVLDEFNYAHGFSRGAELKINYDQGGFRAYANLSGEVTQVKDCCLLYTSRCV